MLVFFFNDTATTEIYTLSLHDALPISGDGWRSYPKRFLPRDPDDGLLFQDPCDLQKKIDALGPGYARQVTVANSISYQLLRPRREANE